MIPAGARSRPRRAERPLSPRGARGSAARVYRAPGRINLIGEHTDYNDGLVMPAAIDRAAYVTVTPRPDRRLRLQSRQFGEAVEFDLDRAPSPSPRHWSDTLRGIAVLLDAGAARLNGADVVIDSQVPMGAGLSSSAAVEVATAYALADVSGLALGRTQLALLCQRASHEFAGTRCGIMDQFIACHGRRHEIARLDTRSLKAAWLPWPDDMALLVCDTGVRHDNAAGAYNRRRAECESAARKLGAAQAGVRALRDVTRDMLDRLRRRLTEVEYARARHVVSENARVRAASAALRRHDANALGRLLDAGHRSLRDDYQVSCAELDLMAGCAREAGALGARMMGAGFGGCVLALFEPRRVPAAGRKIAAAYARATGRTPRLWLCATADGVARVA